MQWLMLQQDQPEDFVIATGVQYSVRQFVECRRRRTGHHTSLGRRGRRRSRHCSRPSPTTELKVKVGDIIVKVDPRYFRPTEVETLLGDPTKAKEKLGWTPQSPSRSWSARWCAKTCKQPSGMNCVKKHGFNTFNYHE